jgi:hypothetical protein
VALATTARSWDDRRVRALMAALVCAGLAAVCGCGGSPPPSAPPPSAPQRPAAGAAHTVAVATQLRTELQRALSGSSTELGTLPVRLPGTLRGTVERCTGPPAGGSGSYDCVIRPAATRSARTLRISVTSRGTWSTTVQIDPRRRSRGVTGLWGFGLRLPKR